MIDNWQASKLAVLFIFKTEREVNKKSITLLMARGFIVRWLLGYYQVTPSIGKEFAGDSVGGRDLDGSHRAVVLTKSAEMAVLWISRVRLVLVIHP